MDQHDIEFYLNEFHGRVVRVMNGVLKAERPVIPVNVEIIHNRWLIGGYNPKRRNNPARIAIGRMPTTLGEMEYTCAHETGHHFHWAMNRRINLISRRMMRKEMSSETPEDYAATMTFIELREFCADFFSILYYDSTEGFDAFLRGRGSGEQKNFRPDQRSEESEYYEMYRQLPPLSRAGLLKSLMIRNYEEIKYLPVIGEFLLRTEREYLEQFKHEFEIDSDRTE